jgi:sec-independent protein translocase protein TatB
MFDIGWSEILVIAVVAIIVVGPKELPRMLRTFGRTMGTVRRTANDFKRQFDEALREAEREVDLEDTRKSLKSIGNPIADIKKTLDGPAVARPVSAAAVAAAAPPTDAAEPADPEPEFDDEAYEALPRDDEPDDLRDARETRAHEAEPLKGGTLHPVRGSDAA